MSSATRLAIHGGTPALPSGPPRWPCQDADVLRSLQDAYASGDWGRYEGSHVPRLERQLCTMHRREFGTLCSSGTIAVELALRGLGVKPGDEVLLAAYDFPGNFRSIETIGATPVLVDIDPRRWSLDPRPLDAAYSERTRALIVSHLHGGAADIEAICRWAGERAVGVVEDACQSPGALIGGRLAGAWGDVSVLSFGGSKLLTAGRGGALLTSLPEVHQRVKIFSERGNHAFPLSELQAAVLLPQLDKLAANNQQRSERVTQLQRALADIACLRPIQAGPEDQPAYYKLAWLYDPEACGGCSRGEYLAAIRAEGVALDAGFRGFARRGPARCRRSGLLEHSQAAAERTILLHHPVLLENSDTIKHVAEAFRKVAAYFLRGGGRPQKRE